MLDGYAFIPNLPYPSPDISTPFLAASQLTELRASDINNSLIHLYRGELGRQIAYRQRLDQSTQYAVTIASTLTVLSFAYSSVPSYVHLLIAFFVCIFLVLETRRYMYYSVAKYRVRQLELGYYGRYIIGPRWRSSGVPAAFPASSGSSQAVSPRADNGRLSPVNGRSAGTASSQQKGDVSPPADLLSYHSSSTEDDHLVSKTAAAASSSTLRRPLIHPAAPHGRDVRSHSILISDANENPNLWLPTLLDSIQHPRLTMTFFQAMCIRLYRVYWGLLAGVYLGWVMKVEYVNEWEEQRLSIFAVGTLMVACTVWIYCCFYPSLKSERWQRWYWTDSVFLSMHSDIDV
jgi:uncharacterized membrane protein